MKLEKLKEINTLLRYYSLVASTCAGSGHPTSSFSAVELMGTLFFGGFFQFDLNNPKNPNNDRLIFSKGHASQLFYSLYAVAGKVTEEELKKHRTFNGVLEGHPTPRFAFTEAATGSLGQGLSIGVGMAINAKYLDELNYKTFVLLGDSEMAEGSVWEAMQLAAYYKLDNLIGVIDVNRLGQRGETMFGHDIKTYENKVKAFGWQAITVDGHNISAITKAYQTALKSKGKPVMIIAKTIKGKGVSFLENKDGWHGKALSQDDFTKAIKELGKIKKQTASLKKPSVKKPKVKSMSFAPTVNYQKTDVIATRKAYGNALVRLVKQFPELVVLDAEVSNSTFAEMFKKENPKRFFEMFIAEQNMVGTATGLARRGKVPFVSTFAAFFTRAFDQIRMAQYSDAQVKFVGSHAGVSIGQDGVSQMGLEDIALFRSLFDSVVLYPADAVATEKLVEQAATIQKTVYLRTTRQDTPIIYDNSQQFPIGSCHVIRKSSNDKATIVAAGITLHEALKAYDELKKQGITVRIIDLYCIKPIDKKTLTKAFQETKNIITVEDHYIAGGIGEAVCSALAEVGAKVTCLAVERLPRSGTPEQLLGYEGISASAIIKEVKKIVKKK